MSTSNHNDDIPVDPVVGIEKSMNEHEGENPRSSSAAAVAERPLYINRKELKKVSTEDDIQDITITDRLRECENYLPLGVKGKRYKRCTLQSETLCKIKNGNRRISICDACYPDSHWWVLLILFSFVVPAETLEISKEEVYAILGVSFSVILAICVLCYLVFARLMKSIDSAVEATAQTTPIVCNAFSSCVRQVSSTLGLCVTRVSDAWKYDADKRFLGAMANTLLGLWKGNDRPNVVLQAKGALQREFFALLANIFRLFTAVSTAWALVTIFDDKRRSGAIKKAEEWLKIAKNMSHVEDAFEFFLNLFNGHWFLPADEREKKKNLADLRKTILKLKPEMQFDLMKKRGCFTVLNRSVMDIITDELKGDDKITFLRGVIAGDADAEKLLLQARKVCKAEDRLLLNLAHYYAATETEMPEPWPEKLGLGMFTPQDNLGFLYSSELMRAAVHAIAVKRRDSGVACNEHAVNIRLEAGWKEHCLRCNKLPHTKCHIIADDELATSELNVLQEIQGKLGFVAWPSIVVGRSMELSSQYVKTLRLKEANLFEANDVVVEKKQKEENVSFDSVGTEEEHVNLELEAAGVFSTRQLEEESKILAGQQFEEMFIVPEGKDSLDFSTLNEGGIAAEAVLNDFGRILYFMDKNPDGYKNCVKKFESDMLAKGYAEQMVKSFVANANLYVSISREPSEELKKYSDITWRAIVQKYESGEQKLSEDPVVHKERVAYLQSIDLPLYDLSAAKNVRGFSNYDSSIWSVIADGNKKVLNFKRSLKVYEKVPANEFLSSYTYTLRNWLYVQPLFRSCVQKVFKTSEVVEEQAAAVMKEAVEIEKIIDEEISDPAVVPAPKPAKRNPLSVIGKWCKKQYFTYIHGIDFMKNFSEDTSYRVDSEKIHDDTQELFDELEADYSLNSAYFTSTTGVKMATLSDKVVGQSVAFFTTVVLVFTFAAASFAAMRKTQREGYRLQAKGDSKRNRERYSKNEDYELTKEELAAQEQYYYDDYLERFEDADSDYHEKKISGKGKGKRTNVHLQGVSVAVGTNPITNEVIEVPENGPMFSVQGKTSCDNLDDIRNRVFSVFDSEDCAGPHRINAFVVGKVLFSQRHAISDDVWLVNAQGQRFHVAYEQWKPYPKSDMVYVIWNSTTKPSRKVSLAVPEVGVQVQMVSARLNGTARNGVVVMKTKNYGWATYESHEGDCGAPVVNNQGLVVGFHQLGTDSYANGFISVDDDMIKFVQGNGEPTLLVQLKAQGFYYRPDGRKPGVCVKNKFFSQHFNEYRLREGLPLSIPSASGATYSIVRFEKGDLEAGLRRYNTPDEIQDADSMEYASKQLFKELKLYVGSSKKSSLDAIHANTNLNAGPGYPWIEKFKKKSALFEADPDLYKTFGTQPQEVWWWAKLKCEVREIGKMARTYMATDVHFAYYANQFFMDFNQKFVEAGAQTAGFFSNVGITPQYCGWHKLKDYLSVFPNLMEGDGKRYDTRVAADFLWRVCLARMLLYEPEESADFDAIKWCYEQTIYGRIKTPEGFECMKMKGTPSGGVNTIVDNTCALFLMFMYVWHRIMGPVNWKDHLRLALTGDDSLVSVSDYAKNHGFTPDRVAKIFHDEIGMDYEVAHGGWCSWSQATYLSRYFDTEIDGITVPRFDFAKMYASLFWSKRPTDYSFSLVRCNGILSEMWTDHRARKILRGFQEFLRTRVTRGSDFYEPAITGYASDYDLYLLYTSRVLYAQSFPGDKESATPGKRRFARMDPLKNKNNNKALKKKQNKKIGKQVAKVEKRLEKKLEKKIVARPRKAKPQAAHFRALQGLDAGLEPAMKRLTVNSENRSVIDVFNSIAMPGVGKNVRIGEEFGSKPSGVASLFNRDDTDFGSQSSFTAQCFAFKSALRFQLASTVQALYNASTNKVYGTSGGLKIAQVGTTTCFPYPLVNTTGEGPHGTMVFPGRLGPSDPFYGYIGNVGDNFDFAVLDAAGADRYNVTMYRFAAREWLAVTTKQTVGPAVINFPILEFGYYAFGISTPSILVGSAFSINAALSLTCGLSLINNEPCWLQTSLPGLKENIDTISNVKFHGLSLMWTNTSNMLAKQGQIAMMQVPADTWFGYYVGYSNVSSKNLKMEANLDAQKGAYLFQKPSTVKDFEYTNEIIPANEGSSFAGLPNPLIATVQNAWFYILPELDYITIALDIPVISGTTDSRSGYWTVRTDIEYTSTDQWRSLQLPTIRKDGLEKALTLIAAAPQFHTNEFHISDLWDWVKDAAKGVANAVVEYGPTVLKVAGMVAPLLL